MADVHTLPDAKAAPAPAPSASGPKARVVIGDAGDDRPGAGAAIPVGDATEASTVDEDRKPLTAVARDIGADAVAEQRELLGLLFRQESDLSGFARRGLLMRIRDLCDVAAELFEGTWTEPYEVASRVYGSADDVATACESMRAEMAPSRGEAP